VALLPALVFSGGSVGIEGVKVAKKIGQAYKLPVVKLRVPKQKMSYNKKLMSIMRTRLKYPMGVKPRVGG